MAATVTETPTIAMELPVVYVATGQQLAEVFVELDGWDNLTDAIQTLADQGIQPRVAYAYQLPNTARLRVKLVLDTAGHASEPELSTMLAGIAGLHPGSVQVPTEPGLVMSEFQRPEMAGTPAVILGRPVIAALTHTILERQKQAGEQLLTQAGRAAGRQAASAVPPLMEQLGMTVSDDLLARRIRDLQIMGWAILEQATVEDGSRGTVTLRDTFEAATWNGDAPAPTCHFMSGFITGVFSFVWDQPVTCREVRCQATGDTACHFEFQA